LVRTDLQAQAGQFAQQLTNLLNRTITDGVRVKSVLGDDGRVGWVGYEITRRQPFPGRPMPIGLRHGKPRCWLHVQHTLHQDDEGFLTAKQSTVALHIGPDPDSNCLFHYDYNRDPKTAYPEAHVQVPGTSPALGELGHLFGRQWELGQLHFPVGSRRFRPRLEDVVEFLIVEGFAEGREGWQRALNAHRAEFHRIQLAAAVRRDPETAQHALEKLANPQVDPPGTRGSRSRRQQRPSGDPRSAPRLPAQARPRASASARRAWAPTSR
jgi:hypothetical protein